MKSRWDKLITTVLVLCAVVTTALVVHREFFGSPIPKASAAADKKPVLVSHWQDYVGEGVHMGPAAAPVQLIEFADLECPFCGSFHKTVKALRERYPTQVALTFVQFPLPMHRFAVPAARVAECAGEQGRFEPMYDQLYAGQESFGLKPWSEYATAAGVADLAAFDICIKRTDAIPRVEQGKVLGQKLDVQGTPTLMVNGWMLSRPPSAEELDKYVQAILAGKNPFDKK